MYPEKLHQFESDDLALKKSYWQSALLKISFFNFFLTACAGLLLRSIPVFSFSFFNYTFLLHAHSHFAFGGWVMPVLIWLTTQYFPSVVSKISFRHWRNIVLLTLIAAYGMLSSFPFQGYGIVSIIFSTLSIIASFYFAILILKNSVNEKEKVSVRFLRAGLFYLMLSALGPFATGPLIAMGKQGSHVYFNVIYFYLHFQYNGWFTFTILSVLCCYLEGKKMLSKNVFLFFNAACIPAYVLSTLWSHPPVWMYWIGGLAALLQLVGVYYLMKELIGFKERKGFVPMILWLAIIAFILKNILQFASAFPLIANLAYENRNFVIAYLHLVLLGFITLSVFAFVLKALPQICDKFFKSAIQLFLFGFILSELLLIFQALGNVLDFDLPRFAESIFIVSCFLPVSILMMFWKVNADSKI